MSQAEETQVVATPAAEAKAVKSTKAAKAVKSTKAAKAKPAAKKAVKPTKAAKPADSTVAGPAVLREYAASYHRDTEKKTASGNVSVDNDDDLANKLRGKALEDVYAMAVKVLRDEDDNQFTLGALKKKYGHLNVGMQRMNLGNRMRATLNAK